MPIVPSIEIGAEANYWRRSVVSLTAVTAIAQLHLPVLPFLFTLFATGTLIHGSSRSLQMVEGGLALTVR